MSDSPTQSADDGWIEWSGGECPIPPDTRVEVKCRDGYSNTDSAGSFMPPENETNWWSHREEQPLWRGQSPRANDIIAYRIEAMTDSPIPSADGWMPIETAPLDGSHILLAWDWYNGTPPRTSEAFWRNDMPFSGSGIWWYFSGRMFQEPHAWMPMPIPPAPPISSVNKG